MEEEFNAWYDSEHLPERLAIPGFRSARRWVCNGTYLGTYELDSAGVGLLGDLARHAEAVEQAVGVTRAREQARSDIPAAGTHDWRGHLVGTMFGLRGGVRCGIRLLE